MKDLKNKIAVVQLLDPADFAHTNTKTNILDLAGFEGAVIAVSIGILTGVDASNFLTIKMQESDTTADADFVDVPSDKLEGEFIIINSTDLDQTTQYVGYRGEKRYIRILLDYTGTGITAGIIAVVGILGLPGRSPAIGPSVITAS